MLQRVLAAPRIQGVAVRQEGLAALLFYHIYYRSSVIGAQEGQVARFAEVHFDRNEFPLKVDGINAGPADQLF